MSYFVHWKEVKIAPPYLFPFQTASDPKSLTLTGLLSLRSSGLLLKLGKC